MEVSFSIDWLHITDVYNDVIPLRLHIYPLLFNRVYTNVSPRYGYLDAVKNQAGAQAMDNKLRTDMGVHVSYSASALNAYREKGIDAMHILGWHNQRGATVSRIDLAFDLRDSKLNIETLYDELESRIAFSSARSWNIIKGHDGGATLYIGSRSSEAMVRIYNKAVEQGELGDWIRVEIELKGDKADSVVQSFICEPQVSAPEQARRFLNGLVYFPNAAWIEAFGTATVYIAPANKKENDTLSWLMKVAAPTLGKMLGRTGNQKLFAEFLRIVRIHRSKDKTGD